MKKSLYSFITLLAAVFAFCSCEDVPAPYDLPGAAHGNSVTIAPTGTGTADDPFNVAAAIAKCKETGETITSEAYYIKGIAKYVDASGIAQYGNITIDMVDDMESTNVFKAFQICSFDGKKFTNENEVQEGDTIVVVGKIYNYSSKTPETEGKGNAHLVSVNGKTEGGNGPVTPPSGTAEVLPYNSPSLYAGWTTMAANGKGNPWSQGNTYTQATGYQKWDGNDAKSNQEVDGYLVSPAINTTAASGNVKMSYEYCVGYANNDPAFADHIKVYVSDKYTEGEFNAADWTELDWKATHTSTNWTLETTEIQLPEAFVNKENVHIAFWFYAPADKSSTFELKTFKMQEGKIGETPDDPGTGTGGEVSENSITVKAVDLGLENGKSIGSLTLADGTVLTFDGGGNTNDPKYYNTGTNIRMYPKNTMKVTAKKKIASIILNCDTYQGTICNASGDISANPGSVNVNGAVVTATIGANETVITDTSEQTGAASQIRFVSLTINYAE